MNTITYYMKVTNLSPMSHIGDRAGIGSLFNMEEIIPPGSGRKVRVPTFTGGAGKGILRRIGMEVMLSILGLDPEKADYLNHDQPNPLTQKKLEVLFNGSILTSSGSGIKVDVGAQLADLIPWFSVVGGCLGNQMIQGRIVVSDLILLCKENEWRLKAIESDVRQSTHTDGVTLIPEDYELLAAREHLAMVKRSHKDDFRGGTIMRFLPPEKQQELLLLQATNQEDREQPGWQDDEAGNHVQMRYEIQTVKSGSEWFWSISGLDWTDLMHDAFHTTLAHFLARPYLGGMKARGFSQVSLSFLGSNRIEPARGEWSNVSLAPNPGALYRNHLEQRRDEIIELLKVLEK